MDELDRILEAQESIEPSSGLADSIMRAVRQEAATPTPIHFPWGRLALGMGTALIAVVSTGMASLAGLIPTTAERWDISLLLADPAAASVGWTVLALAVSYVSYALSLRLAGQRR